MTAVLWIVKWIEGGHELERPLRTRGGALILEHELKRAGLHPIVTRRVSWRRHKRTKEGRAA